MRKNKVMWIVGGGTAAVVFGVAAAFILILALLAGVGPTLDSGQLNSGPVDCATSVTGTSSVSPIQSPQEVIASGGAPVPPIAPGVPTFNALATGKTVWVGASDYGPNPGQPPYGGSGQLLTGTMSFAELSTNPFAGLANLNFSALGNLPYGTVLEIAYGNTNVVAEKLDVGAGGQNASLAGAAMGGAGLSFPGYPRDVDLWRHTAQALNFPGLGVIAIKLISLGQSPTGLPTLTCQATPISSQLASKIVSIATSQLGVHDNGIGNFCGVPYEPSGVCEEWCAMFATWVWKQAGVNIPQMAFTGSVYDWGQQQNLTLPPSAFPSVGDAVLYGTGPSSVSTSIHMGIVVATNSSTGEIRTIEGDVPQSSGPYAGDNAVIETPWHTPGSTAASGFPVYAWVEP